jgi:hypothetical protein
MNALDHYTRTSGDADGPLRIDRLRLVWEPDHSPDLSYLEQQYPDCTPGLAAHYQKQDARRLADYGSGWYMLGCYAEAVISYPIGQDNRRLQVFRSGGLWGIESDSDAVFKSEVERTELEDLAAHLRTFGIAAPSPLEPTPLGGRP